MHNLSFLNNTGVNIIPNAMLKDFTTFRLGGACPALIECPNAAALKKTIVALKANKIAFILMGFGSNILVSDNGTSRVVVRYSSETPLISRNGNRLTVDAATQLDDLILFAIKEGLDGLTIFSGIPGTVGGGITGNAGAYGQQISEPLNELTLLKPDGQIVTVPKDTIGFEYRDSDIKHSGNIILSATFELTPGKDPDTMMKTRSSIIATRKSKHSTWQETPSAGSFFRNVLPSSKAGQRESAGWFLDQAGAKTMRVGGAHVYEKHANIVTHDPEATAQDVYDLSLQLADKVKEKFNIELSREVLFLGKFKDAPKYNEQGYW